MRPIGAGILAMDSHNSLAASDACPTVDRLQAFCQRRLPTVELESISDHVQHCERCASMLLDLSTSESDAGVSGADVPDTVPGDAPRLAAGPTPAGRTDSGTSATVSHRADESLPARVGRYVVLRVIGQGGFGKVLLARDEQLDRLVAVKVPHPERLRTPLDVQAFHREARLHAA